MGQQQTVPGDTVSSLGETDTSTYAVGERVIIRDEEWTVRTVAPATPGLRLEVTGVSALVRDQEAVFFTAIEHVERLDPAQVQFIPDQSARYLRTRLWLDSVMRRSPIPIAEDRVVAGHRALLDRLDFQLRPAATMLDGLRPRILIGDAVGLGKTLEIGIALSELIARGRGERILVVTPRAVLKQFQMETFTRFGIPLVRLDSTGIQRVQRELPAGRNPFAYFKRVIVSIDTLKNPHLYRHHLKDHHWDAVVIDECHNLINRGTQNNALAHVLSDHCDALILASATPHNGSPESFAELISLLDPTAIADPRRYSSADISHLYVRRHRGSSEVRAEIADRWREREQPTIRPVTPSPAECMVLEELERVWLHPASGTAPVSGRGSTLFPWTLFKAFLSSPQALSATIANRLRNLSAGAQGARQAQEATALTRLDDLTKTISQPTKLTSLVNLLKELNVGGRSNTRVAIFSERLNTLEMLRQNLPKLLGLRSEAVRVLHAQLSDDTIQDTVESFGQKDSPIRVLLASDMASEGLNLHKQCHLLIHYDVPWSFIRLQQRNGRIDRYGQMQVPRIHALALSHDDLPSEVRVVTSLLTKEHEANRALGDAGVLMDLDTTEYDGGLEERTVMRALAKGDSIDDVSVTPGQAVTNWFVAATTAVATVDDETKVDEGDQPVAEPGAPASFTPLIVDAPRLFPDDDDFLASVLDGTVPPAARDDIVVARDEQRDLITLASDNPQARSLGLRTRLLGLPRELVRGEDSILAQISLTGSARLAEDRLRSAQESVGGAQAWPDVQFLAACHPVLEWAADRGLAVTQRGTAPLVVLDTPALLYLTQATWANGAGQVVVAETAAVRIDQHGTDVVEVMSLSDAVDLTSLQEASPRVGDDRGLDLEALRRGVPLALAAAARRLRERRSLYEGRFTARLEADRQRLSTWHQTSLDLLGERAPRSLHAQRAELESTASRIDALIQSMSVTGDPHVRILAVLVPRSTL